MNGYGDLANLEYRIRKLKHQCEDEADASLEKADAAYRIHDLAVAASLQARRLAYLDFVQQLRQIVAPQGDD